MRDIYSCMWCSIGVGVWVLQDETLKESRNYQILIFLRFLYSSPALGTHSLFHLINFHKYVPTAALLWEEGVVLSLMVYMGWNLVVIQIF